MTSDVISPPRVSRAGECIDGRYQLEAEIGAGGLGSVYRALQTKLARHVAVKLLHESMFASDVQRARFEREARSLAALEHPNIVSILDYGVADGQPYIVTELLEGETLAQRLRGGSLPLEQGLHFADELLDALAFMHEAGVVHRDLKASNVFLQRVHDGERVKLLDFGLAKTTALAPGAKGDATLTRDGTVVGTPAYMSPEQATGDVVDARSDVYSVGVLLFQMLTGRLPFEGDAIDQVRSHLVEPVPALERTSPSRRLDAALEGMIRRAMAKRREDRFEHAREMLEALAVIRQHGAATLPPTAAGKMQTRMTPRRALPPLGTTLRWLRVFCVVAVVVQLFVILLLVRDAEGRAALVHVGERSGVALTSFSERSLYWGSRLAAWAEGLPKSQRESSWVSQPSAADEPTRLEPRAAELSEDVEADGRSSSPSTADSPRTGAAPTVDEPVAPAVTAERSARAPGPRATTGFAAPELTETSPPSAAPGASPSGAAAPGAAATATLPPGAAALGAAATSTLPSGAAATTTPPPGAAATATPPRAAAPGAAATSPGAAAPGAAATSTLPTGAAATATWLPGAAAPEVSPDAQPGSVVGVAPPSAAGIAPAAPAAAPAVPPVQIAAVPGPPKPRNPWTRGTPAELRGIRRSVLAGGIGDDRVASTLRTYSASHPGDPRGQLLLGMMYLNRNWRSDAVQQFASAIKTDLSARGAPEVLDSLLDLVASGRSDAEASSLITRAYGSEALPALNAKITATREPSAAARLRALRARLDRAPSTPR